VGVFKSHLLVVDTPAELRRSVFGRKVIVHLRSANNVLAEAVRSLTWVNDVKIVDNKMVVKLESPEENNPELVRTLVNAGADIQFVGELRHSLEDVYLQLVKNG
jgi:ABC-2 type transport system ATP-binding protein